MFIKPYKKRDRSEDKGAPNELAFRHLQARLNCIGLLVLHSGYKAKKN